MALVKSPVSQGNLLLFLCPSDDQKLRIIVQNTKKIIILDEPTSSLDDETARKILEIIADVTRKQTTIPSAQLGDNCTMSRHEENNKGRTGSRLRSHAH